MNRIEFVAHLAASKGITKTEAENIVKTFIEGVSDVIKSGDSVQLVGFGSFQVKHQEERKGHNPLKNEPMTIPARNVVSFKVGESLKKAANGQ